MLFFKASLSDDDVVRSHLLDVGLLRMRVGERIDLRAKAFCKENCIVTETTDTDNTDFFAWASAVTDQRGEYRQAAAQHRTRFGVGHAFRQREDELLVSNYSV